MSPRRQSDWRIASWIIKSRSRQTNGNGLGRKNRKSKIRVVKQCNTRSEEEVSAVRWRCFCVVFLPGTRFRFPQRFCSSARGCVTSRAPGPRLKRRRSLKKHNTRNYTYGMSGGSRKKTIGSAGDAEKVLYSPSCSSCLHMRYSSWEL